MQGTRRSSVWHAGAYHEQCDSPTSRTGAHSKVLAEQFKAEKQDAAVPAAAAPAGSASASSRQSALLVAKVYYYFTMANELPIWRVVRLSFAPSMTNPLAWRNSFNMEMKRILAPSSTVVWSLS